MPSDLRDEVPIARSLRDVEIRILSVTRRAPHVGSPSATDRNHMSWTTPLPGAPRVRAHGHYLSHSFGDACGDVSVGMHQQQPSISASVRAIWLVT
jgi:hypothetical protein